MCVYRDIFVMRDIRIATCSRSARSVGENKAPETWPFSMEFVPKGEPEGCEWRGRERKTASSTDGGGGTQLAPEINSFCSCLEDLALGRFCGELPPKPLNVCIEW
jgi:hypothetical protein